MNTTCAAAATLPSCCTRLGPGPQRGAALFIALIALIALTLAGLALVRSVDTSNLIAGNFAFRQAALHASDVGVEKAVTFLLALRNNCATNREAMNQNYPANCPAGACRYYASMRDDLRGIPTGSAIGASPKVPVDWNAVNLAADPVGNGFSVQYVIDRMCQTDNPGDGVLVYCYTGPRPAGSSFTESNPTSSQYEACDGQIETFYRVTVRVAGPRNTMSMVQTIVGAK